MNRIAVIQKPGNPQFDIVVDGRRLAEHFIGRQGSHPSLVVAVGWHNSEPEYALRLLHELLGQGPTELSSGRVAVLVCEECDDVACGALAVRMTRSDSTITWSDWAFENGYEPASEVAWPTYTESFEFDFAEYSRAFSVALPGSKFLPASDDTV